MGWTVRESNPGGGTRPHWPWDPPSLLCNGFRVSYAGVKRPGRGFIHPPPSSAEVKERVELYLYSPSGSSWPVLGRPLPLSFTVAILMEFSWCSLSPPGTTATPPSSTVHYLLPSNKFNHMFREQRNILHEIRKRKANWIGHILRRNCLLK